MLPRTASQSDRDGAEPRFPPFPRKCGAAKFWRGTVSRFLNKGGMYPFHFSAWQAFAPFMPDFSGMGRQWCSPEHMRPHPFPFPIRKRHSPAYLAPFSEEHLILLITNRIRKPWNHRLFLKRFTFFCLRKKCESQERISQTS